MTKEQEKELFEGYDSFEGFGAAFAMLGTIALTCLLIAGVIVTYIFTSSPT